MAIEDRVYAAKRLRSAAGLLSLAWIIEDGTIVDANTFDGRAVIARLNPGGS